MKKIETAEDVQLTILKLIEDNERLSKRIKNNKKAISYHYKLLRKFNSEKSCNV